MQLPRDEVIWSLCLIAFVRELKKLWTNFDEIYSRDSCRDNNNNNNNNTSICKAHNVSIRAESEAPTHVGQVQADSETEE